MSIVKKFNGLRGAVVTRKDIVGMVKEAHEQEQPQLAGRLQAVLDNHPKEKALQFAKKYEPAIECVPASVLPGLQYDDINEESGLNGVSQQEIYDMINNLMLNTIKKVGHLPWQKPWKDGVSKFGDAMNYVTGKAYSGINYIILNHDVKYDEHGEPYLVPIKFIQPYYLTFKQIEKAGAKLNKGSKARDVFYYTMIFSYKNGALSFKTSDRAKWNAFIAENNISKDDLKENAFKIPVIKYYHVFRADDCTGLKFPDKPAETKVIEPIEAAQGIIDHYPNPPKFTFGGNSAANFPKEDRVNMPVIESFDNPAFYYSVFFHELIHSTGHSKRLNRGNDTRKRDGSIEDRKAYAFEELIAELGAVYLSGEAGTLFHTRDNSAKYLKGWNDTLIAYMKKDNKFFARAAAAAQKGANFILDLDDNDVPAYRRASTKKAKAKPKPSKTIATKPAKKKTAAPSPKPAVKLTKEQLDQVNPKSFAKKPKSVSVASATADVLASGNYPGIKPMQANVLLTLLKNFDDLDQDRFNVDVTEFQQTLLGNVPKYVLYVDWEEIVLSDKGLKLIRAIRNRVDSLRKQKHNYSMFDGLNGANNFDVKKALSRIYDAKGCTDISDCEVNIAELKDLIKYADSQGAPTALLYKRMISLKKRLKFFQDKENKKKGLNAPAPQPEHCPVPQPAAAPVPAQVNVTAGAKPSNSKIVKIGSADNKPAQYFTVAGEVGKFLQRVERKPVQSVVITMDGQQGAGKTTTLYNFIEAFSVSGNKCLYLSLEEHPQSDLATQKANKYFSPDTRAKLDSVAEVDNAQELYDLIAGYDIIFLDSWQKLLRMVGNIKLDEDLRKRFNGKVFVIIFQQTTDGRTKGGSEVVFDGDIIIKMIKEASFADNYAYFDKNRYTLVPLETIRYNIASGTTYNPEAASEPQPVQEPAPVPTPGLNAPVQLQFTVL